MFVTNQGEESMFFIGYVLTNWTVLAETFQRTLAISGQFIHNPEMHIIDREHL